MLFQQFAGLIRSQFADMAATGKLFVSSVSGDTLWDLYLNSFAPEDNKPFRDPNSTVNNCNRDKHFIRTFGNIVTVDDSNNIVTMFDIYEDELEDSEYYNSCIAMRDVLKMASISSVFAIHYDDLVKQPYAKIKKSDTSFQLGYKLTDKIYTKEEVNKYGVVTEGKVYTFHHFYVDLPRQYVLRDSESIGTYLSKKNSLHQVFNKGLQIPLDTLQVVVELMDQGSLLRADIYKHKVVEFINIKQQYEELSSNVRDNWSWKMFLDIPFAGFANELIGTTCIDLAEGKDINTVCNEFNYRVDSINYMKAKAALTQRQIDEDSKKLVELGYEDSFNRRFATLKDIDLSQRIHTNTSTTKNDVKPLFANVKPTAVTSISRHKKNELDNIEEVSIETFLTKILPNARTVSVFLENIFSNNLVTLTTAVDPNCKNPLKWDNPFGYTYNGNLAATSNLTQAVMAKGGRVDGVIRFTHSWNELEPNNSLMDAHVFMPGNNGPSSKVCDTYGGSTNRVGWNRRNDPASGGVQDVDYTGAAPAGYIPVENITFPSLSRLKDGEYKYKIHNWARRQTAGRGRAEIAFDGQLYEYIYPATTNKEWVDVATVTLKKGQWSIEHHLDPVSTVSNNLWGLDSNQFHKVNLICLSPNYWGDNAVGNKQYFFLLDKCHSDVPMRSFHIENLKSELLPFRRLLEVFGNTMMLQPTTEQLAGLGFTDDSKESLIVKVEGSFKRVVRVRF